DDRGGPRGRRRDRPRAGRDLLGRLQRRLPRPRRAPLGGRPQPALDNHRGRRSQTCLTAPPTDGHTSTWSTARGDWPKSTPAPWSTSPTAGCSPPAASSTRLSPTPPSASTTGSTPES